MTAEVTNESTLSIDKNFGIWITMACLFVSVVMYEANQDKEISLIKQQVQSNTVFNKLNNDGISSRLTRIEGQLDTLVRGMSKK